MTLAAAVAALGRAGRPQTTTEPATAWMRSGQAVLEQQSPWAVAAIGLCLAAVVVLLVKPRGSGSAAARAPSPLWTIVPLALVAVTVAYALCAPRREPAPPAGALRVSVIGHQWWWEFRYPDLGIATATELHVPVGTAVSLELETADVDHSFWVPALAPRQDMIPERRRAFAFTADRVGAYPGQCAVLCGASHAHMAMRVFVDAPATFAAWAANQRAPRVEPDSVRDGALWRGREVFATHACSGCHTVRGLTVGPGGPDLTHFASRGSIGGGMLERNDANLARWILHADELKPGAGMPGFPVSRSELEVLVAWLQSLR
jgi:cytochrome c oxidase subunit 2